MPDSGRTHGAGVENAVLPMMAASVLNRGITVLENVPRIQDVFCMMGILDSLGCRCALHGNRLEIDTSKMNGWADRAESDGENALVHYAFGSAPGTLLRGRGSTAPADV